MKYNFLFLIIIILLVILAYNKNQLIKKLSYMYTDYMYPIETIKIESDLTNVNLMKKDIDSFISSFLMGEKINSKLRKIVADSLSGGKRLRPIIIISTYKKLTGVEEVPKYVMTIAFAIEIIHCTSLVLDDIMDKDLERRGEKSIHAKYGETYALLVSLYLMTLAIQLIIKSIEDADMPKESMILLLEFVSRKLNDLSLGQYLDIEFPKNISDVGDNFKMAVQSNKIKDGLEEMIHKKTSSLFEMCFVIPWILAKKDVPITPPVNNGQGLELVSRETESHLTKVKKGVDTTTKIARNFGLIYQIADDFEDIQQDLRRDGKNSVMNYAINKGVEQGRTDYFKYVEEFEGLTNNMNMYSNEIKEIITYLNKKVNVYYKDTKDRKII